MASHLTTQALVERLNSNPLFNTTFKPPLPNKRRPNVIKELKARNTLSNVMNESNKAKSQTSPNESNNENNTHSGHPGSQARIKYYSKMPGVNPVRSSVPNLGKYSHYIDMIHAKMSRKNVRRIMEEEGVDQRVINEITKEGGKRSTRKTHRKRTKRSKRKTQRKH